MPSPLRPRALHQCSTCVRSYLLAGFTELAAPTTALRQQIRGKKKLANSSNTVPVRLLKNVQTFGRKGAIVPISPGQMRNNWFPRNVAAYVTLPELKTLRLKNVAMERDFDFGLTSSAQQISITSGGAQADLPTDARGGMSTADKVEASMFQKPTLDPKRLSPERSMELLEIFVPPRLDFYRQPILEEKESEPTPPPEPKKPLPRGYGSGVGAELMAARAQQPEPPRKPKQPTGPQAIYGSVSTHDVLVAVRAAMGENDEARMVVLRQEDVKFVDLGPEEAGGETERVKHVGEFGVEIRVKGVEEGIWRNVRVVAQEVA